MSFSVKYGIVNSVAIHTADILYATHIHSNFEFKVALITPGSVPRVFDKHVGQASGFVQAVTDSEYAMVYLVNVLIVIKYIV